MRPPAHFFEGGVLAILTVTSSGNQSRPPNLTPSLHGTRLVLPAIHNTYLFKSSAASLGLMSLTLLSHTIKESHTAQARISIMLP
jgi:hypothetical protein